MDKQEYAKLLQDPRWKTKRLKILERDNNMCTNCRTTFGLQVHHTVYEGDVAPWEYKNDDLITLCANCHKIHHKQEGMSYRTYSTNCKQISSYKKVGDLTEFNIETSTKVTSSKKIIEVLSETIKNKEFDFILPAINKLREDIVELFDRGLNSRITINSVLKGFMNGTIDIKISYNKPIVRKISKIKYKKKNNS